MNGELRKAAVLGAGTMGSRIAAHLANAGVDCLLLDLPAPGGETPQARNAIAEKALKALAKSRPPALFTASTAKRLRAGNFQDDLERLADADWIIEAIVEKFEPKVELLAKVDALRKPGSIVSTNTSGLPVARLAQGRSDDFRRHWIGTHFFNPPRHMRLLELIPAPETDPALTEFITDFCDRRLGKVVVRANDRPNFIANRIFLFSVMHALKTMTALGLTIEEVDALTGPLIGRPRMATFRLADFTGVDVCLYVAGNLYELVPEDERREVYAPPDFLKRMVEKGLVGDKAGGGFYKKDKRAPGGRWTLDPESLEYRERREPEWPALAEIGKLPTVAERVRAAIERDDPAGRFLWETLGELFLYAAARIPEVCDDLVAVDDVMRAGFNWRRGIFELWDDLGVEPIADRLRSEGKTLPPLAEKVLASPSKSFYKTEAGETRYFDLASEQLKPLPIPEGVLRLDRVKRERSPVRSNEGASLWDLGDGAALLEFHSKANSLDQSVFEMLGAALEEVERGFEALVIGNEGEHFSVGANLMMILGLIQAGRWDEIDAAVGRIQGLVRAIGRSRKPVVSAVFGRTLGGGCEIALRSSRVQAAAETYMGLVETGVGLIPAAGGCAEVLRRWTAGLDEDGDVGGATRRVFEMIGRAEVSNSAEEARERRFLAPSDGLTMNRDRLLAEAKRAALALAADGWRPPERGDILVGGRGVRAELELTLWMMREAMWATDYDVVVGKKLAHVLAGGDLTEPSFVSEDYLLGLEREAFLGLCGEERTRQRIEHLLKTGSPLRN